MRRDTPALRQLGQFENRLGGVTMFATVVLLPLILGLLAALHQGAP